MPSIIHEYQEVEYQIHYEITSRGHPGRGPSLSGPGDPPEGPEWELTSVEQAVYLPDNRDPEWVDIRKTGLSPEAITHIESWAEDQIDPDDVHEAIRDEQIAEEEFRSDLRHDR